MRGVKTDADGKEACRGRHKARSAADSDGNGLAESVHGAIVWVIFARWTSRDLDDCPCGREDRVH